ncbi:MAG: glycosyltransferase family 39 protein [Polyangiaceae bacterium]|nr:glycosyltransferase family 39 protein [Polyangiaceae bacterium]
MSPRRRLALHLAALVAARALTTVYAWHAGFHALSDDDFARVVIAQQFAASPRLDPSGTSWLPAPFWATGSLMMVLGDSLTVARALALVAACVASVALYLAARTAGSRPRAAFLGSLVATAMPLSVFTGAATVPELPTATLAASALLLVRRQELVFGLAAGAAILPATLARYEVWPVAVIVALATGLRGPRARASTQHAAGPSCRFALRSAGCALPLLGPLAWIGWNAHAHGDPLHFHGRVSSFLSAYSAQHAVPLNAWLGGYPRTLLLDTPAATLLALVAIATSSRRTLRSWGLPAFGLLVAVLGLTLAAGTGGAPTHHPERPLLMVWLVAWIAVADMFDNARPSLARPAVAVWLLTSVALLLSFGLRIHRTARTYGMDRSDELALGHWLSSHAEGNVLMEPIDYGYLAVEAAMARPGGLRLTRSVDPRTAPAASPMADPTLLRDALRDADANWLVVPTTHASGTTTLGQERHRIGSWSVVAIH